MDSDGRPRIIQGGMGVGVSDWRLARAVALRGELGVVSGTGLDTMLVRRLQRGDPTGAIRRALERFPWPRMALRIRDEYLNRETGSASGPFPNLPLLTADLPRWRQELLVVANFVEVFLAKEEHDGQVGINYLEKIQIPMLPSLLGAMLAGVDYVLVGAGIPLAIPGALDALTEWKPAALDLSVEDNTARLEFRQQLDPVDLAEGERPLLRRPSFLAIVSSEVVARTMIRRATGSVEGLVVEGPGAGGHNAPPRRTRGRDGGPAPKFGERDRVDLEKVRALGRPFWLAGGHASPESLSAAIELGAVGIQVGTAFALCDESGLLPGLKRDVLERAMVGTFEVRTDFRASPTGFPFKVVDLPGTMSDPEAYLERDRICDLGYLRRTYCRPDSTLGYRCPGEPVDSFMKKGGAREETEGRLCLCNGLVTAIGLGQSRPQGPELPVVTAGENLDFVPRLLDGSSWRYSADQVLDYLLG